MIWIVYNILFAVCYVLMLPKFFFRMLKRGGYGKGFMERFGCYSDEAKAKLSGSSRIWVHAVSVGEVFVALKFMEEIRSKRPEQLFVLTVTTSTGRKIALDKMNKDDLLLYFPVDFPWVVKKVLRTIQPQALILAEGELWPNLIRTASDLKIPVMIINGRMSDSSYRGYKKLAVFAKRVIGMIDLIMVQSEIDAERFRKLGASDARLHVLGSGKYDIASVDDGDDSETWTMLGLCGIERGDLVILGGSTWPGEEKALLEAYNKLKGRFPTLKLVLVPRHAERRYEVESEIGKFNLSYCNRSEIIDSRRDDVDVLLVDTTGELKRLYACASVIFVGKSLTEHGGQNFIEPAFYGKPIITGPNLENFPVVAKDFIDGHGIVQVLDSSELCTEINTLLDDAELRKKLGYNARAVLESKKGNVAKSVDMIISKLVIR